MTAEQIAMVKAELGLTDAEIAQIVEAMNNEEER